MCSESSETPEMELSTKTVHSSKPSTPTQNTQRQMSDQTLNITEYNLRSDQILKVRKNNKFQVEAYSGVAKFRRSTSKFHGSF